MNYESHISEINNPLLPFIFHKEKQLHGSMKADQNWHMNIEILRCIEGSGTVRCESRDFLFQAGQLFVISSNVLHSIYTDKMIKYDCLIVDRNFCASNGIQTDSLHFTEVINDRIIYEIMSRMSKEFSRDKKSLCYEAKIRRSVLEVLILLRENHVMWQQELVEEKSSKLVERIKKVMVYIRDNLSRPLELDEIAEFSGISKYHLSREFKRITGQTIFEHINIVRCKEANRLMQEGFSVSEAAQACGFENMSYFSRMYKKCAGVLPSKRIINE